MKKQKTIEKTVSLKEFYDRYCKGMSFDVLKKAFGYAGNGHHPQNGIPTAAIIYAEPFKKHPLSSQGVIAEKQLNSVSIWNLQTESDTVMSGLLQGKVDFHNRAMCIAHLGENYDCQLQTTLDFPSELIVGVYQHSHRYAAVISIEPDHESAIAVPKLTALANILAKNALVHYMEYLHRNYEREYYLEHHHVASAELPEYKDFFLTQPMRFIVGVNPHSVYPETKHVVSVEDFLAHRGEQLGLKLKVASVDLFGDFA